MVRRTIVILLPLVIFCLTQQAAFAQQQRGANPSQQQQQQQQPGARPEQPSSSPRPRGDRRSQRGKSLADDAHGSARRARHQVHRDHRHAADPAHDGKVAARMFFVAYTKDGEDVKTRPLSFLYNGGPGAATMWLHMGSFAPKHVQMADEGFQPAPPYHLVDNENSLHRRHRSGVRRRHLDRLQPHGRRRQLRAVPRPAGRPPRVRRFHQRVPEDATAAGRRRSILIGESYGTIRSAGLAQELQTRHGIELNGIVLISSLLTYQTIVAVAAERHRATSSYIPTYTADGVVSQEAARGSAGDVAEAGRRRGARVRDRAST